MNELQLAPDADEAAAPRYTVKVASRLTGIPPVTLRAWERRYGLPSPERESQGYRLYSENDLRTLRWLKAETDAGHSIGRAAQRLQELRALGRDPTVASLSSFDRPASLHNLTGQLTQALCALDEGPAHDTLATAFSLYPINRVLLEVIKPAMIEIGERWHRGEIPIATEHFATQFCRQHIMALHTTVSHPTRSGVIVAAGAPGEQHTIGMLMLVAMLRMRGWDVRYLGPDTPLDGMERTLAPLKPRLLMFTCNQPESTRRLFAALPRLLEALGGDAPRVIVGGQAFGRGNIDVPPVAYVIDEDEPDTIALIEHAMAPSPVAFPSPRTEAVE